MVVVSSVNGHGAIEASELARQLGRVANRHEFKAVVGGKLWTDGQVSAERSRGLLDAGFDRVFSDSAAHLAEFIGTLDECREAAVGQRHTRQAAGA
jgi:methylmalonyl-CoA mutase cobalamin-binding subunit